MRDLHLLRFPVWKACLPGLWSWRARAWGTLEEPFFLFPTLLSALCMLCCPVPQSSVGKKHDFNNNKIIKGMSVREQGEGGERVILAAIPHHLGPLCFPHLPPP